MNKIEVGDNPKKIQLAVISKYIIGKGNVYDGGGASVTNEIDLGGATVGEDSSVIDFGGAE